MKFTLSQAELQLLLAKSLGVEAEKLSISVKTADITIDQGIESLSFVDTSVPPVPVVSVVPGPAVTKAKGKKAAEVEEAVIEEVADDDDDIDFL